MHRIGAESPPSARETLRRKDHDKRPDKAGSCESTMSEADPAGGFARQAMVRSGACAVSRRSARRIPAAP
jgi:hypothetical protein